jgi:hypothetical protein
MKIKAVFRRFILMKNLLPIPSILLFTLGQVLGQGSNMRFEIPESIYSTAFRIEVLKSGDDCTVISYVPQEYNLTLTPRDDRQLGVQYLVSGKDCDQLFTQIFSTFTGRDHESFAPMPDKTLVLDSFENINIVTTDEFVGEGCTKVFVTSFWKDNNTPMSHVDDLYLGSDMIIESADPSQINGSFDLAAIQERFYDELEVFDDIPRMLAIFNDHNYYKLKEMQVNKNHIVEKLREDGKWNDITPEDKVEKIKVKRVRMDN